MTKIIDGKRCVLLACAIKVERTNIADELDVLSHALRPQTSVAGEAQQHSVVRRGVREKSADLLSKIIQGGAKIRIFLPIGHFQNAIRIVTTSITQGRGKQSSDLTIKDPNVSRQHAMVEYLNGQYYMVDMGSTNGVEYNGQRIARKAIAEGDLFRICDHEIRFSYR